MQSEWGATIRFVVCTDTNCTEWHRARYFRNGVHFEHLPYFDIANCAQYRWYWTTDILPNTTYVKKIHAVKC